MATCKLLVEFRTRWWMSVYLKTLTLMCLMMRCEPDYQKVAAFIGKHGMSMKVITEPEEASEEE